MNGSRRAEVEPHMAFSRYLHLLDSLQQRRVRRDVGNARIPASQFEEAVALRREGFTMREIGERFGCSRQAVQQWFRLRGVQA